MALDTNDALTILAAFSIRRLCRNGGSAMAHSTRAEKMKVRIPEKCLMFFVLTGMLSIMPCPPVEYFAVIVA
jgi:hypothetical protein